MKLSLNLASRRYLNQRVFKFAYLLVIASLLLLFALQLQTYLQSRNSIKQFQSNLTQLDLQLEGKVSSRLNAEEVEQQQEQLDYAETILQRDAFRWTALFDRMETYLPKGVSIRSFSPDYKKNSLVLRGVCKELVDLRMFLDNLHEASFQQVFLQNQNWTKVKDYRDIERPALDFSIRLEGVF